MNTRYFNQFKGKYDMCYDAGKLVSSQECCLLFDMRHACMLMDGFSIIYTSIHPAFFASESEYHIIKKSHPSGLPIKTIMRMLIQIHLLRLHSFRMTSTDEEKAREERKSQDPQGMGMLFFGHVFFLFHAWGVIRSSSDGSHIID